MAADFRDLAVVTSPSSDIVVQNREDVPRNRIGEPYADALQYLETQFRLLREDLLSPYRDAIITLSSGLPCPDDIEMYSNVTLLGLAAGFDGIELRIKLEGREDVNWNNTRLLMYNSLLCLSTDDFQTFSFAVVSGRSIKALENHSNLGIRLLQNPEEELLYESLRCAHTQRRKKKKKLKFSMFECRSSFLEAYVHAVRNLQRPHMEKLLFLPNFMALESAVEDSDAGFVDWKRFCAGLDETQREAVRHGVTKSLALIQGPPGTGKTFTALRIMRALLAAKPRSQAPVLVVCYTNRALDQFLEGVYEFEKSLVRMGSGSQSRVLSRRCFQRVFQKKTVPRSLKFDASLAAASRRSAACSFFRKWISGFRSAEELSAYAKDYNDACMEWKRKISAKHGSVLQRFRVVGMTATFAARNHELLVSLAPQIMIVEEAAQVTEAQLVGCLVPSLQRLVLVGDHLQLRPPVACYSLAKTHNLDVSLFEKLVLNGLEYRTLGVQRRMRPQISSLVSGFYANQLRDHDSVKDFPRVTGMADDVLFIDHGYPEEKAAAAAAEEGDGARLSRRNPMEARMVVRLCHYLVQFCGYDASDVTVLCMYRAQVDIILERLRSIFLAQFSDKNDEERLVPRVRSVDEFQGQESKIILLSLVRNFSEKSRSSRGIGFLGSANRVCVALSRARHGLYIFGNAQLLRESSEIWTEIIDDGEMVIRETAAKLVCPKHPTEEFEWKIMEDDSGPANFCGRTCDERLHCGHLCQVICPQHRFGHDSDEGELQEESSKCREICGKSVRGCNHLCVRICHFGRKCPACALCRSSRKCWRPVFR